MIQATVSPMNATQVHKFLCTTEAYPEVTRHVELKETHISWVYLTDEFVYKQKKPVAFDFVDFSSCELRKKYCEQEVQLNRRFSPDVYLGTVAVCENADGTLELKKNGEAIEWLVKMRRLDESETLESMLVRRSVADKNIAMLSQFIVGFYADQAPVLVRSGEFLANLKAHIQSNQWDLEHHLPQLEREIKFACQAQLRTLALQENYFRQRVADGRIVEGHGDLRPEHVFFRRGKPCVIDCIEFNAEYRRNDVVDELAFLAMECERHGNSGVGQQLFADYLTATGDHFSALLVPFYKSYRACVRAKVTALRASQCQGDDSETMKQVAEYLRLAVESAQSLGERVVLMVGGLSGTGKSTLAQALQRELVAELLRTDTVRQEVASDMPMVGRYSQAGRRGVYREMVRRLPELLQRSPTVILDGTFGSRLDRELVLAEVEANDAKLVQIECECPAAVAQRRIESRRQQGNDASEATQATHQAQQLAREMPLDDTLLLSVDTTRQIHEQVREVIEFLRPVIYPS